MKHASEDIRNLAVGLYKSGEYTQQEVADIVGYHYNSVKAWLKADAEGRPQRPLPKGHKRRVPDPADLERLRDLVKGGSCRTPDEYTQAPGKGSRSAVHRALKGPGYTYKKNSIRRAATQSRSNPGAGGMAGMGGRPFSWGYGSSCFY